MDVTALSEKLMSDKQALADYIYTPWEQAVEQLEARRTNAAIDAYAKTVLSHGIPEILTDKKSIVLFRHLATPNHEVTRFFGCGDGLSHLGLEPVMLEYPDDQFNDRNQWKYFLGKLRFQKSLTKEGASIFENASILNFNDSNSKPMSSLDTHWGQKLVDFHHELFVQRFPQYAHNFFDASSWLHSYGQTGKKYYKPFMSLFLQDAILFDNFRADEHEFAFTKEVILPAFLEVEKESGVKPLVVALLPMEEEANDFWFSHPYKAKTFVDGKMRG
ncbi:MAG: hypothetical protein JWN18_372 [Parcubacteria group bacterium]|nr:hypothetical protein [Parcubacteria group bacterium]